MPNPCCFPSARRAAGVATWLAAAAWLAGCASLQPPQATPGQTEAEVVARLGPPTGRYTLPAGGQRLEYATDASLTVKQIVDSASPAAPR